MRDDEIFKHIPTGSKKYTYQISNYGNVIRTTKKMQEIKIRKKIRNNSAVVCIHKKRYILRKLVAKYFLPDYEDGDSVGLIKNNPINCAVNNLYIMHSNGVRSNWIHPASTPLICNGKKYNSINALSRELYCSHATILNYLCKKWENSMLNDFDIKYVQPVVDFS